ncbi:Sterol desaturase/sphingolipid hydroxylase, fatty acid hydroxylase superfamily [Cnuella takakiae]|uniref:Sterol desaturase/sphingolipid hydroxylase, fatty acid hydroxylase superfamily n=1 Tax=Cnuella takakiae TaxID=1302690 RepID=A0A1M4Y5M1_9BACT|nr:sterol desaturase family protein [Cnuella takakiae]SHF01061.1 Sterol desaturase/sphingolipid hydroxylase, fatty acid hydroxylase superfamily [Cnuella takakiae]
MWTLLSGPLFGAPEIPLSLIHEIEDRSPNIIIWAAPIMFFFVLLEWFISYRQNRHLYDKKETIGSICVGVGNVIINFLLKVSLFYLVIGMYNALPWRMAFNWWTFIPCYIIFDLCSYWAHRISHQQRFWWATHVVHHSSEFYNLTVSFRLSWVQHLKLIFFLPVALIGFHPIIFFVVNQIAVLFQFWVHTEYIRKLHPAIEYIFATPSNHRVHHGSQELYINKNYGATFIIWDRMFGTYQAETEQPVYGITSNIEDKANPLYINFHEYKEMWQDIKQAQGWRSKLFFLFGDPIDIARVKKSPVPATENVLEAAAEEAA